MYNVFSLSYTCAVLIRERRLLQNELKENEQSARCQTWQPGCCTDALRIVCGQDLHGLGGQRGYLREVKIVGDSHRLMAAHTRFLPLLLLLRGLRLLVLPFLRRGAY